MRRTASLLLVGACAVGCCAAVASAQPKAWDYTGSGSWSQVQAAPAATQPAGEPVANPTLDRAEALVQAGQYEAARQLALSYVNASKRAPDRDRGLFVIADTYYREGDRILAFYQLDEIIETYPESRLFAPALEKQFAIADAYLKGYPRKFLGLPILTATDEAVDMLFRIQERAPGSPIAERAMLRTADYYFNTSQFDLAGDVYASYARSYPRSPNMPRVRLRQAFSSYAQFRGSRFDATSLIDARAQFEDIKARHPDLAAEANVQKFVDAINETLARKLAYTADFYRRTKKTVAAVYTYRQLISTYPASQEAAKAKVALAQMPEWALKEPMPLAKRPAEPPTTGPSTPRPAILGPPAPAPLKPVGKPAPSELENVPSSQ